MSASLKIRNIFDSNGHRRDSFNRFGDDLEGVILSYLPSNDQYRFLLVSRYFLANMFIHSHFLSIFNLWKAPINCLELSDIRSVDRAMVRVETRQYPAILKLYFNLDHNCLRCISQFYNKCQNLRSLKINTSTRKIMASDCVGELLEFIRPKVKLNEVYFGFVIRFTSEPLLNLFVRHYRDILCEFGFTYAIDHTSAPILDYLGVFKRLTSVIIVYYNHQTPMTLQTLETMARDVSKLKRLTLYRSFDIREDVLFNLTQVTTIFRCLNYYYIGPIIGGLWDNHQFMRATMSDMSCRFGSLRREIPFNEQATVVYYSRQHRFVYYGQKNAEHKLVIPGEVRSLAYNFRFMQYKPNIDAANSIIVLNSAPNIVHFRARRDCFTTHLRTYLLDRARANPNTSFCFAYRNTWPLTREYNVWSNIGLIQSYFQRETR